MAAPSAGKDDELLAGPDDLLEPFHSACKPPSAFRVGAEAEKFGVLEKSLEPVLYEGPRGVVRVMRELVERFGWEVSGGDNPLLALEKNGASVTLEPGAQLELSGAPLDDIHQIDAESHAHNADLATVSELMRDESGEGIAWLGVGFHPFAHPDQLPWVPKPRYGVMREYLPTRGKNGLDMMRRTATVQANFDYENEEGAMRMLRVSLKLSPFFTALFANSPFYEGAPFGGVSYRAKVWLDVDPSRQGLVPRMLREASRFVDYVEWALDAPMFLLLRGGHVVKNTGQTFRSFMSSGYEGHRATYGDWVTHLNTMFPEVRLKRTIEVRGADSLPSSDVAGPAALFTGILYDPTSLAEAEELTRDFDHDELDQLRARVAQDGPRAVFRGRPSGEVAAKAVELARRGLVRRGRLRADGRDESVYLEVAAQRAAALRCPADELLDAYRGTGGTQTEPSVRTAVFARSRL